MSNTTAGAVGVPPALANGEKALFWRKFTNLGGAPLHFQSKVSQEIERRRHKRPLAAAAAAAAAIDPSDATPTVGAQNEKTKKSGPLRTRKTVGQQNIQWRNEKAEKQEMRKKYNEALAEATRLNSKMQKGEATEYKTMEQCIDSLNKKHNLSDENENNGKRKKLVLKTVRRNIDRGNIGGGAVARANRRSSLESGFGL